jgi:4-amino-4-deoxy-L-arabinose transferase-like glycosyltransferase
MVRTVPLLVAVVIVALALRFVGLGWGRPFVYHPDEWLIANPAMDMVRTGSWNPHSFTYPSGLIYVERLIVVILHQLDSSVPLTTGNVTLPEQFPYFYAGRAFVAVTGALMVLPTYLAARSISNAVGGIAAAVAIAVAPVGVTNAHYLTTDVPTAALAAVTLWLSLRGLAGGRRWLIAAGFVAGLAASTKYNGGLVVIVPLVVLLSSCPPRHFLRRSTLATAGLIVLASMAGFVLLTPAVLFDPSQVWTRGLLFQVQTYSGGLPGYEGSDNSIYFLRVLWGGNGLGAGFCVLAVMGLLIAIAKHRPADLAILAFTLAYYVLISLPPVRFDRNLLPLLPFLAVLAGRTIGSLVDFLASHPPQMTTNFRRISSVAVGLAVIALAATPSVSTSIAYDQQFRTRDTRTIALEWIERNIPRGTAIARDGYTPQIPDSEYQVAYIGRLATQPLNWYRYNGFEYLVTSSVMVNRFMGHEPEDAFYRSLLAEPIVLDLRPKAGQQGPRVFVVRLGAGSAGAVAPLMARRLVS